EALAHARLEQERRGRLADLSLDLVRVVLLLRAVSGERRELPDGVGRWLGGERGLEQPLRDQVGEPPVRGRRVRVGPPRQAEVADGRLARPLDDVLARAHELDDNERDVGEPKRVGLAPRGEKVLERLRVRLWWELRAVPRGDRDDLGP